MGKVQRWQKYNHSPYKSSWRWWYWLQRYLSNVPFLVSITNVGYVGFHANRQTHIKVAVSVVRSAAAFTFRKRPFGMYEGWWAIFHYNTFTPLPFLRPHVLRKGPFNHLESWSLIFITFSPRTEIEKGLLFSEKTGKNLRMKVELGKKKFQIFSRNGFKLFKLV